MRYVCRHAGGRIAIVPQHLLKLHVLCGILYPLSVSTTIGMLLLLLCRLTPNPLPYIISLACTIFIGKRTLVVRILPVDDRQLEEYAFKHALDVALVYAQEIGPEKWGLLDSEVRTRLQETAQREVNHAAA